MSRPWTTEWFDSCKKEYGYVLQGDYRHWCPDWANLPIDETMTAFHYCKCFTCECGKRLRPKYYPWGRTAWQMHDDIFECPKLRIWNFWKHTWVNYT